MFKNILRLAALSLALVTMSNAAVSFDAPVPTCGPCDGTGN
jgi:hypothetical protein